MLQFLLLFSILLFVAYENELDIFSEINLKPTVKIVSPNNGQIIPYENLTIFGVSTDNPSLNCVVQIDINNARPYQNVTATGPGGVGDFSTWKYTTSKSYHMIKGQNNITAKFVCEENNFKTTKYTSITLNNPNLPEKEKIERDNMNFTIIENEVNLDNNKNNLTSSIPLTEKKDKIENEEIETEDLENITNNNTMVFNNQSIEPSISNLTNLDSPIENLVKEMGSLVTEKQDNTIFTINNNVPETSTANDANELANFVGNFATSIALFNPDIILNSTFLSTLIHANAGNDIVVKEGDTFTLDGSKSQNPAGGITDYIWQQMDNSNVKFIPPNLATWSAKAPEVDFDTKLEFKLTVIGGNGSINSDTVNVTITNSN